MDRTADDKVTRRNASSAKEFTTSGTGSGGTHMKIEHSHANW